MMLMMACYYDLVVSELDLVLRLLHNVLKVQSSDQSHRPTKHICLKNRHVFEIKKIKNKLLITLWFKLRR